MKHVGQIPPVRSSRGRRVLAPAVPAVPAVPPVPAVPAGLLAAVPAAAVAGPFADRFAVPVPAPALPAARARGAVAPEFGRRAAPSVRVRVTGRRVGTAFSGTSAPKAR